MLLAQVERRIAGHECVCCPAIVIHASCTIALLTDILLRPFGAAREERSSARVESKFVIECRSNKLQ